MPRMNALRMTPSSLAMVASTSSPGWDVARVEAGDETFELGATEDGGGFDVDVVEAGSAHPGDAVVLGEGAGDAAGPQSHDLGELGLQGAGEDDVGDREPAAGAQHSQGLAEDLVLVRGQVDDAVGDDDVNRVVGQRDVLDAAQQELDVLHPGLGLVRVGELVHLRGHVQAIGLTAGGNTASGQEYVDASARAQVEDDVAGLEVGEQGRVPAAQRGGKGIPGQMLAVGVVVLGLTKRIESLGRGPARRRGTAAGGHA